MAFLPRFGPMLPGGLEEGELRHGGVGREGAVEALDRVLRHEAVRGRRARVRTEAVELLRLEEEAAGGEDRGAGGRQPPRVDLLRVLREVQRDEELPANALRPRAELPEAHLR